MARQSPQIRSHADSSGRWARLNAAEPERRSCSFLHRNLVIITDSAGHTGVGEVPGGEKIRQVLEESRPLVEGERIASYQRFSTT